MHGISKGFVAFLWGVLLYLLATLLVVALGVLLLGPLLKARTAGSSQIIGLAYPVLATAYLIPATRVSRWICRKSGLREVTLPFWVHLVLLLSAIYSVGARPGAQAENSVESAVGISHACLLAMVFYATRRLQIQVEGPELHARCERDPPFPV
jgi:hypothetical protein